MAEQVSIEQDYKQGFGIMGKNENILVLLIGILLFLVSVFLDKTVNMIFSYIKIPFFDFVLSIITNFSIVISVMLIIPAIILYGKNKKISYLLFASFFASVIFAFALKLIFLRQRPLQTLAYPLTSIINYSFPSMHAMAAFALLPILMMYLPKKKSFWIAFAALVAFSRLYFRFHFLSDVVFGIFAGYFIGIGLINLYERGKLWKK